MKHFFFTALVIALLPATACSFDDRPSSHLPYRADFRACPFPAGNGDAADMKCVGDSYHMQMHARSHSSQSASYVISPEVGAIRIDATARLVSAVPDAAVGVACISTDGRRGYAFVRWSDAVGILETRGGGWSALTETAAAPPPAGGRSAIGATCVTDAGGATHLQMDVDGTVAARATDGSGLAAFGGISMVGLTDHDAFAVDFTAFSARRPDPAETAQATAPPSATGQLPLADDFSDRSSGWPTLGDRHGSVAYHGGGYVFAAADAAMRFVPVPAGRAEHAVAARVTVTSAGGGWAGIGCRMGGALLAGEVSPAGGYRIIRHDGSLTRLVAAGRLPQAASRSIVMSCVDGPSGTAQAALSVDDRPVASVGGLPDSAGIAGVGMVTEGGAGIATFDDFAAGPLTPHGVASLGQPPAPRTTSAIEQDDFSTGRGTPWDQKTDSLETLVVRGGRYRFSTREPNLLEDPELQLSGPATRVDMQVDVDETGPLAGAGLSCTDGSSAVHFEVAGGAFSIWSVHGASGVRIAYGRNAAIHTTGTNHLHALCDVSTGMVRFAVNGRTVATRHAKLPQAMRSVRLVIETGRAPTALSFDNLRVLQTV